MRGVFCVCTFATLRFSPYFCANIPHRAVPSPKATVRTPPLVLFFSTMKILITGAAGFVGCRATRFLGLSHQVIPLDSRQLDITDEQRVQTLFMDHAPKAVIHLAALADTGYCETHPDDCEAVNYDGTLNVARAAAAVGAKLIYAGSDQVYNGCTGSEARGEDALLSPRGVYARVKYRTECEVQALLPTAVCLRLSWMYDVPNSPLRQNHGLLLRLLESAQHSTPFAASTHECRGITNVWQVVRRIEAAIGLPGGIYNFGSPNHRSTYDTVLEAARFLAAAGHLEAGAPAPVCAVEQPERNLSMSLKRIEQFGLTFPDTITGLKTALLHGA